MIGTHDEQLETQQDRERAEREVAQAVVERVFAAQGGSGGILAHTGWADAGPAVGLLKELLNESRKQTELLKKLAGDKSA